MQYSCYVGYWKTRVCSNRNKMVLQVPFVLARLPELPKPQKRAQKGSLESISIHSVLSLLSPIRKAWATIFIAGQSHLGFLTVKHQNGLKDRSDLIGWKKRPETAINYWDTKLVSFHPTDGISLNTHCKAIKTAIQISASVA